MICKCAAIPYSVKNSLPVYGRRDFPVRFAGIDMPCQSSIVGIISNKLTNESSVFGVLLVTWLLFGVTMISGSLIPSKNKFYYIIVHKITIS